MTKLGNNMEYRPMKKSEIISLRIQAKDKELLQELAKKEMVTLSEYVVRALNIYLETIEEK